MTVPYATLRIKKFQGIRCVVDLYWVCPPDQGTMELWGDSMMLSSTHAILRSETLRLFPEEWTD